MQKYWRGTNFVGAAAARALTPPPRRITLSILGRREAPILDGEGEITAQVCDGTFVINGDPAQAEPTILELLKKAPSLPRWPAL